MSALSSVSTIALGASGGSGGQALRVRITGSGFDAGWADRDRDYLVLYVLSSDDRPSVVLLDEEGFHALVRLSEVEVTDDRIPPGWTVSASPAGIDLGPPEFHSSGFWSQLADERGPDDDGTWQQPTYRRVVWTLVDEVGTDLDAAAVEGMPAWGEPE